MASATGETFSCSACNRAYAWKAQLGGKKVKCKCGNVMNVPASAGSQPARSSGNATSSTPAASRPASPGAPSPASSRQAAPPPQASRQHVSSEDEALYALAEMEAEAAKHLPVEVISAPAPALAAAIAAPAPSRKSNIPLAYQRAPSLREQARDPRNTVLDARRDIQVPIAFIIAGAILYIGYYAFRYQLGISGIAFITIGLVIMTVLEAAVLIAFAFMAAGPLSVSFGGIGTAILKLAAIAVFCDGVTTWVDAGIAHISGGVGGGGVFGFGAIGLPVASAIYWLLMIYLFSMDPGDSWMVVVILSVFYRIVRIILIVLLMQFILSLGGAASAIPIGGTPPPSSDPTVARIADDQDTKSLVEANKWIDDGHQLILKPYVQQWYDAGAKHVWFEVGGSFGGGSSTNALIVEMPKAKAQRDKCREISKAFYEEARFSTYPDDMKESGYQYLIVRTGG